MSSPPRREGCTKHARSTTPFASSAAVDDTDDQHPPSAESIQSSILLVTIVPCIAFLLLGTVSDAAKSNSNSARRRRLDAAAYPIVYAGSQAGAAGQCVGYDESDGYMDLRDCTDGLEQEFVMGLDGMIVARGGSHAGRCVWAQNWATPRLIKCSKLTSDDGHGWQISGGRLRVNYGSKCLTHEPGWTGRLGVGDCAVDGDNEAWAFYPMHNWDIEFLGLASGSDVDSVELSTTYDISRGRDYEVLLFEKDCETIIEEVDIYADPSNPGEVIIGPRVVTPNITKIPKDYEFDMLSVGLDVDEAKITSLNIWNSTASLLEICQVVRLCLGSTVIAEDKRVMSVSFDLYANFEIEDIADAGANVPSSDRAVDFAGRLAACKCDESFDCDDDPLSSNGELLTCVKSTSSDVEISSVDVVILSQGATKMTVIDGGDVEIPSIASTRYVPVGGVVVSTRVPANLFDFNGQGSAFTVAGAVTMRLTGSGRRLVGGGGIAGSDQGKEVAFEVRVDFVPQNPPSNTSKAASISFTPPSSTSGPTTSPTTSSPSSNPTYSPTTSAPPTMNTTPSPTSVPSTPPTSNPTNALTSAPPTRKPTGEPTNKPTTSATTNKPMTSVLMSLFTAPTAPTTHKPTSSPNYVTLANLGGCPAEYSPSATDYNAGDLVATTVSTTPQRTVMYMCREYPHTGYCNQNSFAPGSKYSHMGWKPIGACAGTLDSTAGPVPYVGRCEFYKCVEEDDTEQCVPGSAGCSCGAEDAVGPGCQRDITREVCSDAAVNPWSTSVGYVTGDVVRIGATRFKCREWPYNRWCNVEAYQPTLDGGISGLAWLEDGTCP